MIILVVNGPNLNLLGRRDPEQYGKDTLEAIEKLLTARAKDLDSDLEFFQSNHEGALIDFIQQASPHSDGILINPGALTHYGYSLHDALVDSGLPMVEVHLSDIKAREEWRRHSVIEDVAIKQIAGLKSQSYIVGLQTLVDYIRSHKK